MKKEDLRKVSYDFGQGTIFRGLFHEWLIKKDADNNEYASALIEDIGGHMIEVQSRFIHFDS